MKQKLLTFLAVVLLALVVALVLNLVFRGDYRHLLVIIILNIFLAMPLALIALITGLAFLIMRREWILWTATIAVALAVGIFAQVPFLAVGNNLLNGDIEAAKKYCETLAPALEAQKAKTGAYPASLDELKPAPPKPYPRLLRHQGFYCLTREGFKFEFNVEQLMACPKYEYYSGGKDWQEFSR